MSITVTGRKLIVSDALRAYAEEKIGNSMKVIDINPLNAEVVLHVEKNPAISARCCCEVTLRTKGHVVRVEESEEDMYAAVDVAAAKVVRQLRKYKTRVIDRKLHADAPGIKAAPSEAGPFDPDKLMSELAAEEEAVVRVKEIEFEPLTEEEALVKIDLLGHDFFAYTDRDTGVACVMYRRANGGYGILRQTA